MDEDALQINQAALRNEEGPVREDEALIVRSEADGTRTRNHRRDKPEL